MFGLADGTNEGRPQLDQLLCAYYGVRCRVAAPFIGDDYDSSDGAGGQVASRLFGNLVRGIPTQEGLLRLEPTESSHDPMVFERELNLLDQQVKRQSGTELEEPSFLASHGQSLFGADLKRKAFTPRIGRR